MLNIEELAELIDPHQPTAITAAAVMHLADYGEAAYALQLLANRLAPGTWLALPHVLADGPDPDKKVLNASVYTSSTRASTAACAPWSRRGRCSAAAGSYRRPAKPSRSSQTVQRGCVPGFGG
ncbi:SAM-dependent methyltransferase [Nonomuraea sp. NPDC004702]